MRIISGSLKGRKLGFISQKDVKPLTDRIKESLFQIIHGYVPDSSVLDLYAGCGSFGIEALSRGAERAVFVDNDPDALRCIRNNLSRTGLEKRSTVRDTDVFSGIRTEGRENSMFRVVFFDPPFANAENGTFFSEFNKHAGSVQTVLENNGLLIVRIPTSVKGSFAPAFLTLLRKKKYGRSTLLFFAKCSLS